MAKELTRAEVLARLKEKHKGSEISSILWDIATGKKEGAVAYSFMIYDREFSDDDRLFMIDLVNYSFISESVLTHLLNQGFRLSEKADRSLMLATAKNYISQVPLHYRLINGKNISFEVAKILATAVATDRVSFDMMKIYQRKKGGSLDSELESILKKIKKN